MTRISCGRGIVRVEGHSGYAPRGQDLVCAGISTLIFTLLESLSRRGIDCALEQGEGYMLLRPRPERAQLEQSGICMETVVDGLRMLAESYPEYVEFTEEV